MHVINSGANTTSIVDDDVSKMKYYFYSGKSVWEERTVGQLNYAVVYLP